MLVNLIFKEVFVCRSDPFRDVFDISCDIGDFREHIFCHQMTQELPDKHYDGGLNNCLQVHSHKSIMDTLDTVKIG